MSTPPHKTSDDALILRVVASLVCVFFLTLALKMGAESFHARAVGMPMSNWKGGVMDYADGLKLTAAFALFAVLWCYGAIWPQRVIDVWVRRRSARK